MSGYLPAGCKDVKLNLADAYRTTLTHLVAGDMVRIRPGKQGTLSISGTSATKDSVWAEVLTVSRGAGTVIITTGFGEIVSAAHTSITRKERSDEYRNRLIADGAARHAALKQAEDEAAAKAPEALAGEVLPVAGASDADMACPASCTDCGRDFPSVHAFMEHRHEDAPAVRTVEIGLRFGGEETAMESGGSVWTHFRMINGSKIQFSRSIAADGTAHVVAIDVHDTELLHVIKLPRFVITAHGFSSHSRRGEECRHCKWGAGVHASVESGHNGSLSEFHWRQTHPGEVLRVFVPVSDVQRLQSAAEAAVVPVATSGTVQQRSGGSVALRTHGKRKGSKEYRARAYSRISR